MKKTLLLITIFIGFTKLFAQDTTGEIAHWNMNGSTNDVSGNGNNGTGYNITPAIGEDGVMGHAYYFNGVNSYISVPYSPSFNVTGYTITASVKVMGYYTGTCATNSIFIRGNTNLGDCVYSLVFSSQPAGYGCTGYDTSEEVFWTGSSAPSATLSPPFSSYNYTPYIVENKWYNIAVTFNDTFYQAYINDTLMSTAYISDTGLPMGTGTQGISIGYDLADAPSGYPYPFTGVIDDVRLFNRPLSATEIKNLGDTCGTIITQPKSFKEKGGDTAIYTIATTIVAPSYQWQSNSGYGFVNLSNAGPYSGVYTDTLRVSGVTTAMNNYQYRCIVSNSSGCIDTSSYGLLQTGISNLSLENVVSIFPNPVTNIITIETLSPISNGTISIINEIGQIISEKKIESQVTKFETSKLPPGMYIVKVQFDGQTIYKKVVKM